VTAPNPTDAVAAFAKASGDPEAFRLVYSMLMRRYDDSCRVGHMTQFADEVAAAAVQTLRDAGRLVPPGGTSRIEWAVRVDEPHPARKEKRGAFITRMAPENARHAPKIWAGWTTVRREIQTWPGGWRRVGPWVPVPTTPDGSS
jgi:hypothetical protein